MILAGGIAEGGGAGANAETEEVTSSLALMEVLVPQLAYLPFDH